MQKYIEINNINIPTVIRSYRTSKHIKLYFKANVLCISKPKFVSNKKALEFVDENKEYIYNKYMEICSGVNSKIKQWNNGEIFIFKGQEYKIETIQKGKSKIGISINENDKIILITYPVNLDDQSKKYNIDKLMKKILKYYTELLLEQKVPYWSKITNIQYKQFKVNDATSKFGSCIPVKKYLYFSSRLIMLPEEKIDAIIVHELCHIIYPNHSKDFYSHVKKYIPNYEEINKWLKKNGKIIVF